MAPISALTPGVGRRDCAAGPPLLILLTAVMLACAVCCKLPSEPEQFRSAKVSIESVYTGVDAAGAYAVITFTVTNRDSDPIGASSISFEVTTDVRRHVHQVEISSPIPSGSVGWFETRLPLDCEGVAVARENVRLLSAVFQ